MAEIKDCCSCIYATRSTFTEPCVSCGFDFRNYTAKPEPKRKRKTNADIIRSMSDEELLLFLMRVSEESCSAIVERESDCSGACVNCWLSWMNKDA